jgi:cell division initiation protein
MGLSSQSVLLFDAASSANRFIDDFIWVYILLIFVYVLSSWIRVPYSPWIRRIQDFLRDVCEPYLRLFRRLLPSFGRGGHLSGDPDESGRRNLQRLLTEKGGASMAYTPVELRHVRFKRALFGYQRAPVDRTIDEVADSFETVWRERADYADRIEHLQAELKRHRELETLLRTTLTGAEQTAHELKDQARREAALVLEEAHAEARRITRDALAERERLGAETHRIKALLGAALDAVGDADGEPRAEAA